MTAAPFAITDEMIDAPPCTALGGGKNYGAIDASPLVWPEATSRMFPGETPYASEVVSMGATLLITLDPDVADDGRPVYVLTRQMMVSAIRRYCKLRKVTPAAIDDDPVDASGADAIVQLALFGEIIFG